MCSSCNRYPKVLEDNGGRKHSEATLAKVLVGILRRLNAGAVCSMLGLLQDIISVFSFFVSVL